jgi:hypothetical protein
LRYSNGVLLHRDKPEYGLLLKLVLIMPIGLLAAGIYLWLSGEMSGSLALLIQAVMIGLIFWLVFPREYQVYEDHLRIVLGGPFAAKVGFENVRAIRVTTSRTGLTVNFATRITRSYVEIVKKRGLSIAITPADNDSFVENANQALGQWSKTERKAGAPRFP